MKRARQLRLFDAPPAAEPLGRVVAERPCLACGKLMRLTQSRKTGAIVPVSAETGLSHFLDCTDPGRFSASGR